MIEAYLDKLEQACRAKGIDKFEIRYQCEANAALQVYEQKVSDARDNSSESVSLVVLQDGKKGRFETVDFDEAKIPLVVDEAKDKYKDVFSIIHDTSDPNWMDVRVPGGESVRDSLTRGQKVLERIAAEGRAHGWHKIGVATHGALMFNLYQAMFGEEHKFENCECFIIEI